MPILWRYLLKEYLKTFVLCTGAFVAILLAMRLDEIANFITLGPDIGLLAKFVLQQIPYILPITLPVAALIASMLVAQKLSLTHELTAARACGFSLKDILFPILALSLFFSALNFYIVSEMTTQSLLSATQLKNQLRSVNPLLIIHNKNVMRMKGFYFDTLGPSQMGEFARDIIFLAPSHQSDRVNVVIAKELKFNGDTIHGDQVTVITAQRQGLLVENMGSADMTTEEFSNILDRSTTNLRPDHMVMSHLMIALHTPQENRKQVITEIMKRISVGLSVFTFTLMGLAFGISIGRYRSGLRVVYVLVLAALYLVSFFVAKEFNDKVDLSTALYFVPHLLIIALSCIMLHRVSVGRE